MTVTKGNPMFQASQPVRINDPTHFWHIKSGVLLARDPEHPGFWEVSTAVGKRWFHESEMELAPTPVPAVEATPEPVVVEPEPVAAKPKPERRSKAKGLPRTILVPPMESTPCSP